MFPAVIMMISLVERESLVKLFYQNKGRNCHRIYVSPYYEFLHVNNLWRGPIPTKDIQAMIKRFEEMTKLGVQHGRGRKPVTPVLVDVVRTVVAAH